MTRRTRIEFKVFPTWHVVILMKLMQHMTFWLFYWTTVIIWYFFLWCVWAMHAHVHAHVCMHAHAQVCMDLCTSIIYVITCVYVRFCGSVGVLFCAYACLCWGSFGSAFFPRGGMRRFAYTCICVACMHISCRMYVVWEEGCRGMRGWLRGFWGERAKKRGHDVKNAVSV